ELAQKILRSRGEQPRPKHNRLICLVPDFEQVGRLKDMVRVMLAWRSIEADIKDLRLTLANHPQRQATEGREQDAETVLRLERETYRRILAPVQLEKRNGGLEEQGWEDFMLNSAAPGLGREIERVVAENELVIGEWAPIHLNRLLAKW